MTLPIIFLHGFLGNPSDWQGVISNLPSCHPITPHLPGHGSAPFTNHFPLFPLLKKFHLVGYSMGGRIAMQYARQYPEQIESLIILSAHPGLQNKKEKKLRLISDEKWATKILTLPIDEFLKQWYDQPLFQSFKPDFSMRRNHNPIELAKMMMFYSLGRQSFYKPKKALYLVGEKDEKYRVLHPDATVIQDAGHMIHLENPKAVAQHIEQRIFS